MGHPNDDASANADVPVDGQMIGGATPESMLDHTALGYLYERDILLEIAWHQAGFGTLFTGDRRSSDLFVRDSDADVGDYPSPRQHWRSPDIWVRNNPPTEPGEVPDKGHEAPIVGAVNYMYVRVNNRGSERADDVSVEAFHCNPGTGMLWPDDFHSMGMLTHPGGIDSGANATLGPFHWTPSVLDHECLLAVANSPDDPTAASMFHRAVPHWQLVRFDNTVGQRNVSPIRINTGGSARSSIRMRGGVQRSVNRFELDAKALPRDTKLRLRVAGTVLKDATLTALRETGRVGHFATLEMRGGDKAAINGFELPARARKSIRLEIDFSVQAEHERRYPLVASQIQDGELAGELTIDITAIRDAEDYVYGNPRSRELHTVHCPHWPRTLPTNRLPFRTVREGIARGYNGCRFCLPEYDTDRDT